MYAARLVVNKTPRTLSESFAILRQLKTYGAVSTFVRTSPVQEKSNRLSPQEYDVPSEYYVIYNSLAKAVLDAQSPVTVDRPIEFKVEANARKPKPRDLDPYNVRGLLERKPAPRHRNFACTLTLDQYRAEAVKEQVNDNEYIGSFKVGRNDRVERALIHAGLPRTLTKGLRPKIQTVSPAEETSNKEEVTALERENKAKGKAKKTGRPELSEMRLMAMYREAVAGTAQSVKGR